MNKISGERELSLKREELLKLQKMKKVAALFLGMLETQGYIYQNQISQWDVLYNDDLTQKGKLAGTIPYTEGPIICVSPEISESEIVTTLAHEIVHVMQYMKGDAERTEEGKFLWKGELYEILPSDDPNYCEQPWEKEAYELSQKLLEIMNRGINRT